MKSDTRNRLVLPIVIPIGILLLVALVLFGFSRILLSVTPDAATGTALVVAATILIAAAVAASRTRVREATIGGLLGTVAGVAMLAGGIAIVAIGPPKEAAKPFAVTLVAPDKASINGFAKTSLTFPAGRPVNLTFENQEPGQTHDVVIATDQKAPPLFTGALVQGPGTAVYKIKPLQPGTYFYYCQVHPSTMTGTLTVSPQAGGGAGGGGGGGGLTVTAQNTQFDTSKISLPGGQPSTLTFNNLDPGTPHNIGIYEDQAYTKELFKGTVITGVATATYHIPALQPGSYFFKCDIHSTMTGTVEVTGGGGAASASGSPPGGGPSPSPGASGG